MEEATQVFTDRQMDKENVVCVCVCVCIMEYYPAIKKWNTAICSNMDGPRDYHTQWSQTKSVIWYHLYLESKK